MTEPETRSNIDRLHAMLKEISVESDVKDGDDSCEETRNYSMECNLSALDENEEETNRLLKSMDYDFDDDDSWLYQSPKKGTPSSAESPEKWIESNLSTPELNRIKGALSSKLDLITLENRKGKFDSLVSKHNLSLASSHHSTASDNGRHTDAAAASLDWEFDEDYSLNNQNHRSTGNSSWQEEYDEERPFTLDFPEEEYEDLKPLALEFEAAPATGRHSAHSQKKAPTKLRRTSSGGNNIRKVDKYDLAVDELVATPTGNVRPRRSKYQFERSDSAESDSARSNTAVYSDQSDVESVGSNYSDSLPVQPRGAGKMATKDEGGGLVRPRGKAKDMGNSASPRGSSSNLAAVKPRSMVRPRTSPSSSDGAVKARLPANNDASGIVRPRGSSQVPSGNSMMATPRGTTRGGSDKKILSPGDADSYAAGPRSSLPQPRKSMGIASPRGSLPVAKPRRSRSRSPDPTAKAIPRGSAVARSTNAGY